MMSPPMLTLGFNCYMRDAAAVLVRDGEVIRAVEEERLSRIKNTGVFPERAIRFCLSDAGVDVHDLDAVAFNMRPWEGLSRRLAQVALGLPSSLAFANRGSDWAKMSAVPLHFARRFGRLPPWQWVGHHEAHAASAAVASGWDDAAVFVADGSGEIASTTTWHARSGRLTLLEQVDFPHSLGYFYSALTEWLGFTPASDEGTTMGLSSHGSPNRAISDRFAAMLALDGRITPAWFRYQDGGTSYYSALWTAAFGPARRPDEPVTALHEDVAYAGQRRLEEVVFLSLRRLQARTGCRRVALAGGVALNSVVNGKILTETPFDELFVQPAPHDAGTAMGAAWVAGRRGHGRVGHRPVAPLADVALGPAFGQDDCEAAVRRAGLACERVDDAAGSAAAELVAGAVVGWFQGRAEFGPRALGRRSLLADPRHRETQDRVNHAVKGRELFRPFAPSVLEAHAADWFDGPCTPFMTTVVPVRNARRGLIAAVTHVDGTARPQTVRADTEYGRLITAFYRETGIPMVLNTSFNVKGEPIVTTPDEAIADLLGTSIDVLYLGDLRVLRPGSGLTLGCRCFSDRAGRSDSL
ncbi:MAG: carbamoyltransferase [Myxococcales bacterium]|nr:carbamoyltransferase [Myxococcales bacterium]